MYKLQFLLPSFFSLLLKWKRIPLSDDHLAVLAEAVLGDLEVEGGGSLSYATGDVVVGAVAGAEPAAVVAGLADGDTAEMRADACLRVWLAMFTSRSEESGPEGGYVLMRDRDHAALRSGSDRYSRSVARGFRLDGISHTQHHKPLGVLDAVAVGFGVAEGGGVDLVGLVDLSLGPVTDEDRLATPLDDDLQRKEAYQYRCSRRYSSEC